MGNCLTCRFNKVVAKRYYACLATPLKPELYETPFLEEQCDVYQSFDKIKNESFNEED